MRMQAMDPSLTMMSATFGMLSPADGISAARNKRNSARPADDSAFRLHHIRDRGHCSSPESLRLDVGGPDDLGPFLGVLDDQLAEVGG